MFTNKILHCIWLVFEHPYLSLLGRIISMMSFTFTVSFVILFCTVTLPCLSKNPPAKECTIKTDFYYQINLIEILLNTWFTVELFLRFLVSPLKKKFILNIGNIIDLLSITSFALQLFKVKHPIVLWVPVMRVFRTFRLTKLFHSFKDLLNYDKLEKLLNELGIPVLFMLIGVILFSSFVYYSESDLPETKFKSIPHSFWYAIITMTTVIYYEYFQTTYFFVGEYLRIFFL